MGNGNLAVERTRDRTLRRKQGKGGKSLRIVEQQVTRQETERRTHHVLRVSSSFSPSFLRLPSSSFSLLLLLLLLQSLRLESRLAFSLFFSSDPYFFFFSLSLSVCFSFFQISF